MDLTTIIQTPLFRGMDEIELNCCLAALEAREKEYRKDALLLRAGETTARMSLVLSGSVTVEMNDAWGNRTVLSHVGPGQVFAETYALLPENVLPVDVSANEDCRVLQLRISGLMGRASEAVWQRKLIQNLLAISAQKNLTLSARSFHTAPKCARARILAYLNTVALQSRSTEFDIPFDRQQLADYLNLERTSLSKELGRMQRDGLITCRKGHFRMNSKENQLCSFGK